MRIISKRNRPRAELALFKVQECFTPRKLQKQLEGENEERDITETNKVLLKLIKKLKGFDEEGDNSESEESDNN